MKVAIIHYWFITRRGGEKVVETLLKLYPNADIYTLFYDEKIYGDSLKNYKITDVNTVSSNILSSSGDSISFNLSNVITRNTLNSF